MAGMDNGYLRKLAERFVLPEGVDYRQKKIGVPMGEERWEIPHGALLYAREQDRAWEFDEALYARRFGFDGNPVENVMEPAVVARIADELGLDGAAAAAAHESPPVKAAIADIAHQGERDGVFGVPFFVLEDEDGREVFWGNDHIEYLLRAIRGGDELPVIAAGKDSTAAVGA